MSKTLLSQKTHRRLCVDFKKTFVVSGQTTFVSLPLKTSFLATKPSTQLWALVNGTVLVNVSTIAMRQVVPAKKEATSKGPMFICINKNPTVSTLSDSD